MSKSSLALSCALLLASCQAHVAHAQVFSLDDNPTAPALPPLPLSGAAPFPPFGMGAEDPFGVAGVAVAPSPSLAPPTVGPFFDGDILFAGPAVPGEPELNTAAPTDGAFAGSTGLLHTFINGLSNNSSPAPGGLINMMFSIDRLSAGAPHSDSAIEAGLSQHPGDIYVSTTTLADPAALVGTLPPGSGFVPGPLNPPAAGSNRLLFDESALDLTAGLGGLVGPPRLIPPGAPAPPMGPGTHDNVDAFELRDLDVNGDAVADIGYYFTVAPDGAVDQQYAALAFSGAVLPYDAANIRFVPPGTPPGAPDAIYALAGALGLAPMPALPPGPPGGGNDIDGLVVFDPDRDGLATPGLDYALFSLAPGSADLAAFGNSPADVFFTDFSGSYAVFAMAGDLGLTPLDNVDALEIAIAGDTDLNGSVDLMDLITIMGNYGAPGDWRAGDVDGDGVVSLSDLVVFSRNLGAVTGAATGVPEPASAGLLAVGVLACVALGRRARRGAIVAAVGVIAFAQADVARAAHVNVATVNLGGGLYQHVVNVERTTGDVLGFDIQVADPAGRINDIDALGGGADTAFANTANLLTITGDNPAADTHVLYDDAEGINIGGGAGGSSPHDTSTSFSIATAARAGRALVAGPPGVSRDMFQLVTRGNIALFATRLRVNVGGAGGDLIFDGFRLQQPPPPGDFNLDKLRDGQDFLMWQRGESSFPGSAADLGDWEANFGVPVPAVAVASPVPEPSTVVLLLTAALAWRWRPARMR